MASKNSAHSFVVAIPNQAADPNNFYKKGLMDLVTNKYPWLTVDGQNPPPTRRGVDMASHGNLITFGTADKHDVSWIERPDYARERGLTPVLDLIKDWNTITAKLKTFAESKMTYTTEAGAKVTFHQNYVKVGYKAYAYSNQVEVSLVLTKKDILNLYLSL